MPCNRRQQIVSSIAPLVRRMAGAASAGVPRCLLYADGACRGNGSAAADAGCGGVLFDAERRPVFKYTKYLGHATNNEAEYQGLIVGLRHARDLGITDLAVRMDSKLVVMQVRGEWRAHAENLAPLCRQVRALADEFASLSFDHVPRAENKEADALSNQALDEHSTSEVVGSLWRHDGRLATVRAPPPLSTYSRNG